MENNGEDYELKSMCSTELENLVNRLFAFSLAT